MSVAQTVGTPAPAATESAPSAESHGIDSILGDLSDVTEAADTGGDDILDALAGDQATPEPETAEPPPERSQRLDDEVIFSDEALSTKDGLLKAKARNLELRKLQHQKYLELKSFEKRVAKRHEKLTHQVDKYVTNKRNDDLLLGNVRSNLQALHSNDPNAIITALGNLTGQDGLKAYELITSHIVNRGPSKLDPQMQAIVDGLQNEIRELKGGIGERDNQQKIAEANRQIGGHVQNIQQQILNTPTLPHLARVMRDDPERLTSLIVNEITKTNGTIPAKKLFEQMEEEIRAHFGGVAPQGDSGGPAPKQPPTAQRSPGQSIGPRSTAAATQRVPTENEALKALAEDSELMSQLGL